MIAILCVLFLDNFGLSIVYPIFTPLLFNPDYTLVPTSFSLSQRTLLLGFLIAAFPLAQFFGAPILGDIADRKGRKKAFYFSLIGEFIGFICTGISLHFNSYIFLIISRLWTGFFAGNLTICLASISDMSPDVKSRAKNFGWIASVAGISFIIAIFIGGIFSNHYLFSFFTPSFPFWFTAGLTIVNLFIIIYLFDEGTHHLKETKTSVVQSLNRLMHLLFSKELGYFYPLFFFFMLGWVSTLQFLSAFLLEHYHATKELITFTFLIIGLIWFIGNVLINKVLIKRFSISKILIYSLLFLTISMLLATLIPLYIIFLIFLASAALFAALTWTNFLTIVSLKSPMNMQGKILGLNQSVATFAMIFAPIFGGLLAQFDTRSIYLFSCSALIISLIICFSVKKRLA